MITNYKRTAQRRKSAGYGGYILSKTPVWDPTGLPVGAHPPNMTSNGDDAAPPAIK